MNYYVDQDIIEVTVKDVTFAPPKPPTCGAGYKLGGVVIGIVATLMVLPIVHHVAMAALQPPCDETTAVCYKLF